MDTTHVIFSIEGQETMSSPVKSFVFISNGSFNKWSNIESTKEHCACY